MKLKVIVSFVSMVFLITVISLVYYRVNYKTLDEAISESHVPMDEVFHTTDYKGHTIIFYGKGDMLSVGLIEKTHLGYRWDYGVSSKQFNEKEQILTRTFCNL
ncbi:hypothetical protein A8990_1367 [Paenibacillus taihuensis]|uniref:Uncharacterized protein n=1 Tax=Paenibacillus taihuensis TaxID=1156355 RepID=A0A3D9QVS5_9BACL|nr:hypothetical protein [Paenibacillus taihuensis]REE68742.1 hypothetical protein A8990_1367 [Paenibacillus taihuensis]